MSFVRALRQPGFLRDLHHKYYSTAVLDVDSKGTSLVLARGRLRFRPEPRGPTAATISATTAIPRHSRVGSDGTVGSWGLNPWSRSPRRLRWPGSHDWHTASYFSASAVAATV